MIDKKGEKYWRSIWYIYACFPCFIHKGGEVFMFMHICFVLQIGEKEFDMFHACFMHVYLCIFAFMFSIHCIHLMFIAMYKLRGSFFEALL